MAVKHKNIYLYLTLVCFLGIVLIFIFDGYIGVYDTLSINAREFPQKIEADQWQQQARYGYLPSANIGRGVKVPLIYEVDNRRFSSYAADIEVSVWHGPEKVADLTAQIISLAPFDKGKLEWLLDTAKFVPAEMSYDFTIIIKRGEIERRVIIYVDPVPYPAKPIIIQPPGGPPG